MKMQVGRGYIIYAYVDEESYRIVASAKVERYLSKEMPEYKEGELVDILIWQKTDLGFKAIVDNKYSGLLYQNEIFQSIETGMRMKAYVKQVRDDAKIDLELQRGGARKVDDFAEVLLQYLEEHEGRTSIYDKSEADEIYATFGVSKKTFKKAVGELYKKRLIVLEEQGIRLKR
jgi:predicted RNA-binding protein (virulence factor B family)